MSELYNKLFSAPANCLAENTENGITYLGNLVDRSTHVQMDDVESCRGHCMTKGAKYFTYSSTRDDRLWGECYCMNAYTERREEEHPISGNTNLSMCNGE